MVADGENDKPARNHKLTMRNNPLFIAGFCLFINTLKGKRAVGPMGKRPTALTLNRPATQYGSIDNRSTINRSVKQPGALIKGQINVPQPSSVRLIPNFFNIKPGYVIGSRITNPPDNQPYVSLVRPMATIRQ